jgi:hypothetical protein
LEIRIPGGTNVTIHGNGAVLDAAQKRGVHRGRFFNVDSGGTLALDHLTLQHGSVSDNVSASRRCQPKTPLMHTLPCQPKTPLEEPRDDKIRVSGPR